MRRISLSLVCALMPLAAHAGVLRVCSDPNNLPFSNRSGQGFENKIAYLVARDLHDTVAYTYALQNDKFIKHTLKAGKCDVLIGVSTGIDEIDTTDPYYASTYVFVSRKRDALGISSLADPRLRALNIGVHLIGDDATPPTVALGQEGIVDNVHGYMIQSGFDKPNPPARLIEAVERKDVDVAAVWGPLGGYFSKSSPVPLSITPMSATTRFAPLQFQFAIAMGVRKGDPLKQRLDAVLARERLTIHSILVNYGVPLVDIKGGGHG
jgi:quinoprotein dehydrogenase-associated probable ABC transporter substrate-binding protein